MVVFFCAAVARNIASNRALDWASSFGSARNDLRVYVCPDPDEVAAATKPAAATAPTAADAAAAAGHTPSTSGSTGGGDKGSSVVLRTKPILHVQLKQAELLCLDWSPHEPDLLLAGASDGEVFVPVTTLAIPCMQRK